MELESHPEASGDKLMLPPPPGTFQDREDLIEHVRNFGADQGYVVTIKKSRRDRRVILGCDRGGVYRNRRKTDESKRKRKASSRLINCPFEAIGKKGDDDVWVLMIKNGEHNHEPLRDMAEHPYSRRFTEEEVRQIKQMTEAGVKPRQVLKSLKQTNPDLQSTPRHLYNIKAKIRQGKISESNHKSWRPNRVVRVNTCTEASTEPSCPEKVPNYIGGKFVNSQASTSLDVINPATQEVVSQVPLSTYEELKAAVATAKQVFPTWKNTPITTRQRIMFKLQELIHRDIDKLARNIAMEQGKTLSGAKDDLFRGLEVVEYACGMATLQMGEFVPNASCGIDTYCVREPLGVCAGICPFHCPTTISLWMFAVAVTLGNTFILKPSEKNPGASMILATLAAEAGLPDGVLNIVHGTHEIVDHICDDDDIKSISYDGANNDAMHIYARAAVRGKRFQSITGGKNHAIIMPDASADATLDALVAACFGAGGQRCMTLRTAIFVGGSAPWEQELVERAKALKVNAGTEAGANIGPVISEEAKDQICRLVQTGVESGARLVLDGRSIVVPQYERGSFVGPTILCDVRTSMDCYKEEMFGPVLLCMQVDSLEDAMAVVSRSKYRSGASIFTTSGVVARKFQNEVEAELVGINVPVPIASPFSSSNGSKASFAGGLSFCGKAGVEFYTQTKTVAQLWKDLPSRRVSSKFPPTSETEISSRGVSLRHPPTSESDLPSQEVSPIMPSTSDMNMPSQNVSLPTPQTSDKNLPNTEVFPSMPPITERELFIQEGSASESYREDQELSLSASLSTERNLTGHIFSQSISETSERAYLPQTSHWGESVPQVSQGTSGRIFMTSTTQSVDDIVPKIGGVDALEASTADRLYTQRSCSNDNGSLGSVSLRYDMQRTDINLQPTQETEVYIPLISHQTKNVGLTSQRADTTMQLRPDRMFFSTSHGNDNTDSSPLMRDTLHQTSAGLYMSYGTNMVQPQRTNAMTPGSEKIYMPTATHRNEYSPLITERAVHPSNFSRNVSSNEFHDIGVHETSEDHNDQN